MIKNVLAVIGAIAVARVLLAFYDKNVKKPLERAVADAMDS